MKLTLIAVMGDFPLRGQVLFPVARVKMNLWHNTVIMAVQMSITYNSQVNFILNH